MPKIELSVTKSANQELALTNCLIINSEDHSSEEGLARCSYVYSGEFVYMVLDDESVKKGHVGVNKIQRNSMQVARSSKIKLDPYIPTETSYIHSVLFEVDTIKKQSSEFVIDTEKLGNEASRVFRNFPLNTGQKLLIDFAGAMLELTVGVIRTGRADVVLEEGQSDDVGTKEARMGVTFTQTEYQFAKNKSSSSAAKIKLKGNSTGTTSAPLFRPNWNFEDMGIGGLDKEFSDIFRRAFASRVFPPQVVAKLGINHVRGILLYGPPGTGKTLMARQIGKMLNAREPKIVNGPEILNKYVGASEENIRNLFKDAEDEQNARGDDSDLHIIIFDEIDAICRKRGARSADSGVGDTVVNQLLSKIDGVESLNNVLVIGMTNRKDMLDEALLRPGRMEVQIEISLPNEEGRMQILHIHSGKARKNGLLSADVDINELAGLTKNFSGAEIEGLVKSATSFALNRNVDPKNLSKVNFDNILLTRADFLSALEEVIPAFGVAAAEFEGCLSNGFINYGSSHVALRNRGEAFVKQVKESDRTPLVSVLFKGPIGSGKTALVSKLALESDFPYVKLISSEQLLGHHETGKAQAIQKVFQDAYKSDKSLIVLDDIERLLDYVPIGPRFSNTILQTLLVLINQVPPPGHKLLIFATSSTYRILEDMGLAQIFAATVNVPNLTPDECFATLEDLEVFTKDDMKKIKSSLPKSGIPMKKLLMITEMARVGSTEGKVSYEEFIKSVGVLGL